MSIKKRLLVSNLAMIVIPVIAFFAIEILIGFIIFVVFDGSPDGNELDVFLSLRFVGLLVILVVTNGLLTYVVARSIIRPIKQLVKAAQEIANGNLDSSITLSGNDELAQLGKTFEHMRQQLKETEALNRRYEANRKELIASISHDLKTPITSIKGYVSGIKDGVADTPEKMDRYVDTIARKANELDQLIDELFLYSKLTVNQVPFHLETMNIRDFVADYIEELRFDVEEKGGVVRSHWDDKESYTVKADREKLHRVISNIVQNSLKYMGKELPEIDFFLTQEQQSVTLQIKDNGRGISKGALAHIFDQFYREDTSRNSATGGSGIGLAVVKQIMEGHNGRVWAESEEGNGTSIFLSFPKAGDEK